MNDKILLLKNDLLICAIFTGIVGTSYIVYQYMKSPKNKIPKYEYTITKIYEKV